MRLTTVCATSTTAPPECLFAISLTAAPLRALSSSSDSLREFAPCEEPETKPQAALATAA